MASVEAHSSNDIPTTSAVEPKHSTVRELRDECEVIWDTIQDTHHRLASHLKEKPAAQAKKVNAIEKILQCKQKKLRAQLNILESQDIEVVSKDAKYLETVVINDVMKTLEQLQETLVIIKGQRQELAGEIEREKRILEEQMELQRALQREILHVADDARVENQEPRKSIIEVLQANKKKAKRHYLNVMKQLGTFLSQYFPAPQDELNSDQTIKGKPADCYCSLMDITEVLMNRLFESPHDPYIKLLPTHWPPYIELLLRTDIIQRHPNDPCLIRLVGYHV